MILFGLFIWICWILFISAVLLPLQEKIEMEAFMKQVKAEEEARLEAERLAKEEEAKKYYFYGWF